MYRLAIVTLTFAITLISCSEDTSEELSKNIIGKDGAEMVLIPAGEFQMGSDDGTPNQRPVHTVELDAFYMGKYEVTNAQYRKFVQTTGYREPELDSPWGRIEPWRDRDFNGDDQPVTCISWEDATAYADWSGNRLPTEAEWEYAARGGLVGKQYPWGDELTHDDANYFGTEGKDIWEYTSPVGSFAPNAYGLYDMVGNVWEWCNDWYDDKYYKISPRHNPIGPISGRVRVLRGGSWDYYPIGLRVADRDFNEPAHPGSHYGFRCARDVNP